MSYARDTLANQLYGLFDTGYYKEAEAVARKMIKRWPVDPQGWIGLDGCLLKMGTPDVRVSKRANELAPKAEVTLRNLAATYLGVGEPDKALAVFEKLLALYPGDYDAVRNIGLLLSERDLEAAIKFYKVEMAKPYSYAQQFDEVFSNYVFMCDMSMHTTVKELQDVRKEWGARYANGEEHE